MAKPHRPSARLRTLVWVGYWIVLFVLTHTPMVRGARLFWFSDKIGHFCLFFLLALLGGWRYRIQPTARVRGLLIWGVVYTLYAGLDEWLQQFVGRSTSLGDFWANLLGIAAASAVHILLWRPRALSDRPRDR